MCSATRSILSIAGVSCHAARIKGGGGYQPVPTFARLVLSLEMKRPVGQAESSPAGTAMALRAGWATPRLGSVCGPAELGSEVGERSESRGKNECSTATMADNHCCVPAPPPAECPLRSVCDRVSASQQSAASCHFRTHALQQTAYVVVLNDAHKACAGMLFRINVTALSGTPLRLLEGRYAPGPPSALPPRDLSHSRG